MINRHCVLWNDFITVFKKWESMKSSEIFFYTNYLCSIFILFLFTLDKPFDRKFKCVNVIYNKDVYILVDMPWKLFFLVSWEKENKTWSYYFCVSMQLLFSFSSYPSLGYLYISSCSLWRSPPILCLMDNRLKNVCT